MTSQAVTPSRVRRLSAAWVHFFTSESAGGVVLALAAVIALVISNSALGDWYASFLRFPGEVRIGGEALVLAKPLILWVNDLWMAVFFFLVGLDPVYETQLKLGVIGGSLLSGAIGTLLLLGRGSPRSARAARA